MKKTVNWKKIEKSLYKYKEIMVLFKCSENIEKDEPFQKKFKTFYRMYNAHKDPEFYKKYFKLLKKANAEGNGDIHYILTQLKHVGNKNELSFASKLLATVNTKLPIWDSKVRERINEGGVIKLKNNYKSIEECVEAYNSLLAWYKNYMKSADAKKMIENFDSHLPKQKITPIKKVDFIFWQTENK